MFTMVLFILPSGVAITALTCAEYLTTLAFADNCGSAPGHIKKTLAVLIISESLIFLCILYVCVVAFAFGLS